jgi:hypothetical protein
MRTRDASLWLALLSVATPLAAQSLTERYRDTANRLIDAALADTEGYNRLAFLCYRIGHRLSGSPELARAVEWSAAEMKAAGLSNVQVIPVKVPHWVRGSESARILAPVERPLHMLGLGMSVGTPAGGITGEVVAVSSFTELERLGRERVQGRIVLFNQEFHSYSQTSQYRMNGPSHAAALGAIAALVRSVTPLAVQLPHTGMTQYDAAHPRIPAAAVSPEDAMMMASFYGEGLPVRVHLQMEARMEPDADSGDVIGEIPGKEHPEEVVVLGGHLDSWDVGQGAQDDGAAVIAAFQALALMKKLGLEPRRTIRVVFWVNEENGSRGGEAYRAWVGDGIRDHAAAIEMDSGAEAPRGFGAATDAASMDTLRQIGRLLQRIGAAEVSPGGGGEDIAPLMRDGVPGLAERTSMVHYFDWHHSEADTLDKVGVDDFRKNVAALAVMSYVLADMPGRLAAPGSRTR